MIMVLFVAVLAGVVVLTGTPLWRPVVDDGPLEAAPVDPNLEVDRALSALNEVEYDYRMNKLSEHDYQELQARYSRRAIALMQTLEAEPGFDEADADLEAEAEAEIQALQLTVVETPTLKGGPKFCPQCGTRLAQPAGKFCPECGYNLKGATKS